MVAQVPLCNSGLTKPQLAGLLFYLRAKGCKCGCWMIDVEVVPVGTRLDQAVGPFRNIFSLLSTNSENHLGWESGHAHATNGQTRKHRYQGYINRTKQQPAPSNFIQPDSVLPKPGVDECEGQLSTPSGANSSVKP